MDEIDKNPASKTAQDFYKSVKKFEESKSKPRKRPAKTIVMTMKGGRVMSKKEIAPAEFDTSGKEITAEEAEFNRKYVDFNKLKWPEVNPIELVRPDYKQKGRVKL